MRSGRRSKCSSPDLRHRGSTNAGDDEPPFLILSDTVVAEDGGPAQFAFSLSLPSGKEISADFISTDGSAVAFCYGRGHMAMGLAVLKLAPPSEPDGLPSVVGEPEYVVSTKGTWHVHNGGWSADSKQLVYTRDMDYGDIFELVERR